MSLTAFQAETGLIVDTEITFTSMDTEMAITIDVIDDSIALELTESLLWTLTLITMRDRAEITPFNTSDVQIVDDDGRLVHVQYTQHTYLWATKIGNT